MLLRKIQATGTHLQMPIRFFIKHSRKLICAFEEPFYRTNDPMSYAVLFGVLLGTIIFFLFKK